MNRPEQDRPESAGSTEDRFWQAFAQAAGFDDEFRELIASGEIDAVDAGSDGVQVEENLTADDYLAADQLHELLLAAREVSVEPVPVELAPRRSAVSEIDRRRSYRWVAAATGVTLASALLVAASLFLVEGGSQAGPDNAEVASTERLAEEWVAVREEAIFRDVDLTEDVEAEPTMERFDFDETPDWLVLVVERQAERSAGAVEEATP